MGEVTSAGHCHFARADCRLCAGFVFPGTTRILHRQFSLTIAFAIAFLAFNALTLSPALSAMFLRGEEDRPKQVRFSCTFARFRASLRFYSLHRSPDRVAGIDLRQVDSSGAQAAPPAAGDLPCRIGRNRMALSEVPTGFIPQEDQGYLIAIVQAPPDRRYPGTSRLRQPRRCHHWPEPTLPFFPVFSDGLQLQWQCGERWHDVHQYQAERSAARQGTLGAPRSRCLTPKLGKA